MYLPKRNQINECVIPGCREPKKRGIAQRTNSRVWESEGLRSSFPIPLMGERFRFGLHLQPLSNPSPYETALNRMWLAWPGFYTLRESPPPSLGG